MAKHELNPKYADYARGMKGPPANPKRLNGTYTRREVIAAGLAVLGAVILPSCGREKSRIAPPSAVRTPGNSFQEGLYGQALPVTPTPRHGNTDATARDSSAASASYEQLPRAQREMRARLDTFKARSHELESFANGAVSLYKAHIEGGTIHVVLVHTRNPAVYVDYLTTGGARVAEVRLPDGRVDTVWNGIQPAISSVSEIAREQPTRTINGQTYYLRYAGNGPYTNGRSILGTIMRDYQLEHPNPEWVSLCLDGNGNPHMGKFIAEQLNELKCRMAIGYLPVIIAPGEDGYPRIATENPSEIEQRPDRFMGFNPWHEKIANYDEYVQFYNKILRHSVAGINPDPNDPVLVFANSTGVTLKRLAAYLADELGVTLAAKTDADTYNGWLWKGTKEEIVKEGVNGTFGTLGVYTTR